jgi:hypothetical protein
MPKGMMIKHLGAVWPAVFELVPAIAEIPLSVPPEPSAFLTAHE